MSFQQTNKRGLAYNCERCGEDSPFIAERYRMDSHIWKRHLSLDCSPYYCTLCMFKATSQPAIKRHCRTFKPHLNQREEMVREGSFRGDDFYIHQSQNAYVITDMDRKPLSPTASRLHWMQVVSIKPFLPVSATNATPVPSETQDDTLPLGFESSDLPLTPPAADLPSRSLTSPSLASPVRRILELEEQDVTSRLEDIRAVPALSSSSSSSSSSSHHSCPCKEELPKLFQVMDRMEKMLERIESRQQKADSETKSVYITVSTGISYLRGQVRQLERNQQRQLLSQPPQTKKRPARRPLQQSTLAKAQKKQ